MDAITGLGVITGLAIGVALAVALAWIILPFAVFGVIRRLEIIIKIMAVSHGFIELSDRQRAAMSKDLRRLLHIFPSDRWRKGSPESE